MRTIPIPDSTVDVLFSLLDARPPRLVEDIEDLRDATIAEAEYAAGQGRPFNEYDAERKARGDVQG